MSDEAGWSIRNVPLSTRRDALAAAARRGVNIGAWIDEAVRRNIAAEREPVAAATAPIARGPTLGIMVELEAWTRMAAYRASLRAGRRAGRISKRELTAFRRLYDRAVAALSEGASHMSYMPIQLPPPD